MSDEIKIAAIVGVIAVGGMLFAGRAAPPAPQVKTAHVVKQQEQKKTVAQPAPKPKAKAKAKRVKAKARPAKKRVARESFCERVKRGYARMTWAERLAAYQRATPQQIAAGRRCLGM